MNIVFLDSGTLPARPLRFDFPHTLQNHPHTAPDQTAARLAGADIVITNKVAIRAEHFAANPQLKLVALAATGYDNVDLAAARAAGVEATEGTGIGGRVSVADAGRVAQAAEASAPAAALAAPAGAEYPGA